MFLQTALIQQEVARELSRSCEVLMKIFLILSKTSRLLKHPELEADVNKQ